MKRILFVDDEKAFRIASKQLLEASGYIVDTASDGEDASKFLEHTIYDFIITDIVMPRKEGIELILDIRKTEMPVKIIAISGGGRAPATEYLSMARAFEADAILSKPYSFKELLSILKKFDTDSK
jgi:CheY-like chemotaxis protein